MVPDRAGASQHRRWRCRPRVAVAACSSGSDDDPGRRRPPRPRRRSPSAPTSDGQLTIGVMLPPAASLLRDSILNGVDDTPSTRSTTPAALRRPCTTRSCRRRRHGRDRRRRPSKNLIDRRRRRDHRPDVVERSRASTLDGHHVRPVWWRVRRPPRRWPRRLSRPRSVLPDRAERLDAGERHRPGRRRDRRAVGHHRVRRRRLTGARSSVAVADALAVVVDRRGRQIAFASGDRRRTRRRGATGARLAGSAWSSCSPTATTGRSSSKRSATHPSSQISNDHRQRRAAVARVVAATRRPARDHHGRRSAASPRRRSRTIRPRRSIRRTVRHAGVRLRHARSHSPPSLAQSDVGARHRRVRCPWSAAAVAVPHATPSVSTRCARRDWRSTTTARPG